MRLGLTDAEAVLYRTGPNNITILFEASGPFDAAKALRGLYHVATSAERFRRPIHGRLNPRFGKEMALEWAQHVNLIDAQGITATQVMNIARRLALPVTCPLWRALIVNPDGGGWSGVVLHFDHAIADGTRISRHIIRHAGQTDGAVLQLADMPCVSVDDLEKSTDPRLVPPPSALVRLGFDTLSARVPYASGHADALLRLTHQFLGQAPEFTRLPQNRRDYALVARLEALRMDDGSLGNRARMERVDLFQATISAGALFTRQQTPFKDRARLVVAKALPASAVRALANAEFSRPGIVLTVVPGARKPPRLFGFDVSAIHPAAPVLGRPPVAVTAVRWGHGFDLCVTAHGPKGESVAGLAERCTQFFAEHAHATPMRQNAMQAG